MSWRRLLVLVDNLPPESALNTAIRNETPEEILEASAGDSSLAPWSSLEMLVASLLDEMRNFSWMYVNSHSSSSNTPRPEPIKKPGSKRQRGKRMTIAEAKMLDPRLRGLDDDEVRARMAGRMP